MWWPLPASTSSTQPSGVSRGVCVCVCVRGGGSGDSQDRLGQSVLPGPLLVPPGAWFLSVG